MKMQKFLVIFCYFFNTIFSSTFWKGIAIKDEKLTRMSFENYIKDVYDLSLSDIPNDYLRIKFDYTPIDENTTKSFKLCAQSLTNQVYQLPPGTYDAETLGCKKCHIYG